MTFLRPDRVVCAFVADAARAFPLELVLALLADAPRAVPAPTAGERAAARDRLRARAARALSECRKRSAREDFQMNDGHLRGLVWQSAGRCWLTGVPMTADRGPRQLSVDRVDSSRPYVYGNVQPVCLAANLGKRDRDDGDVLRWLFGLRSAGRLRDRGDDVPLDEAADELPADEVGPQRGQGRPLVAHDVLGAHPGEEVGGLGPRGAVAAE